MALGRRGRRHLAIGAIPVAGVALFWAAAWVLAHAVPLPVRLAAAPSVVVAYADGQVGHVFLAPDDRYRIAADLDTVDPRYLRALLRYEDRRFAWHPGVDPLAVLRAAGQNLSAGRVVSGASTITIQLVRVLEPRPRNLRSKLVEALRALQLEIRLDKREILGAYLTFLPYGGNLEGVEAASWSYFGHGPEGLSPDEIATLLAVPQSPAARAPSPSNGARLRRARNRILAHLVREHAIDSPRACADPRAWLAGLEALDVPTKIRPQRREFPHAARRLSRGARPGERVRSTLERSAQRLAEELLSRERGRLAALGVHNGAVVIVDRQDSSIAALVGNMDFWDDAHAGQIAAFDAPRSPGSTLKPLIYALALDHGLALPERLVRDVPVAYGIYAPENYDGSYVGLVKLEDALAESRNVPFVELLSRVGVERFLSSLRAAGARSIDDRAGHYGLSAAIGALEVSPLELAGIYAALAGDGSASPLRLLADERRSPPARLVSRGSAWLTRRALSRRDRPDFPGRRELTGVARAIHWKTGTSYGHRDAWAAGSGRRYTAVVWLGNLDFTGARDLVGADAAGPILFDLLEGLGDDERAFGPSSPPRDLTTIEVCALSGQLPTPACPSRRSVLGLRRQVPTERCGYHVFVEIDVSTGLAVTPACRAGRPTERRVFTLFPSTLRRFLSRELRHLPERPTYAPGCATADARRRLAIVSPPREETVLLLPGVSTAEQEIPLEAEAVGLGRLSWFVDGEFLGHSRGERLWWRPSPGDHELRVVDESGRTAAHRVRVRARW